MIVRVSGIAFALMGMVDVPARGEVQISHSIAEFTVGAQENISSQPCNEQARVEILGTQELYCIRENTVARAESIASVSMSAGQHSISMSLLSDSSVSGFDPDPKSFAPVAGGAGWANVGFSVTDEPMLVTVTIVDIATDPEPSSFKQRMSASWGFGSMGGSVNSHAGQTTQTGVLTGTIQPGELGTVFLEIEDVIADRTDPNAFGHVELTVRFAPATCSAPNAASTGFADPIHWNNPNGGSYSVAGNWDPTTVPVYDCLRSDTAIFDLNTGSTIAINAAEATAGNWRVLDGTYDITGPAELFSTSAANPSLEITGATFTLSGSNPVSVDLVSVDAAIGPGLSPSVMEVTDPGTIWENAGLIKVGNGMLNADTGVEIYTDELLIGSVSGVEGKVVLVDEFGGQETFVKVAGLMTVGGSGSGALEVREGAVLHADEIAIGEVGAGSVLVKGTSNNSDPLNIEDFASLLADTILSVGGAGGGTLTIEDGGAAQAKFVLINAQSGGTGHAVVDGQGGLAMLNVLDTLTIGATEQVEVEARNGGVIQSQLVVIGGNQARPGAADLTIRGSTSQQNVDHQSTLRVFDHPNVLGPAGLTLVGADAPGQLNILEGGQASLEGGLRVGGAARGVVVVSMPSTGPPTNSPFSTLSVTGDTQIGFISAGFVTVELGIMHNFGDLKIGNSDPAQQSNFSASLANVDVQGTLEIGNRGPGAMTLEGSNITCETLLVGGSVPQGRGVMKVTAASSPTISGNVEVGVGAGSGLIEIDSSASLSVNGTMTVGGPGGGAVIVNGLLNGGGIVVVVPNGQLKGNGVVTATKVNAGGYIAPGLSPGTLTIEGDYELLGTGAQIIEYAGLNPGDFDRLIVTGAATLGGRLEVHFRNGFSPPNPNAFIHSQDFIEPDQGIVGDYSERIYAFPDEFADFDDDDDKDLKDVRAFQNCFGRSGNGLQPACDRADWEDNGVLDDVDVKELSSRLSGPE